LIPDIFLGLAKSSAGKIAQVIGKPEDELLQALDEAEKLLPEARKNKLALIKRLGIDRKFVDDMYEKYGHYADKVPGIGRAVLDSQYRSLTAALDNPQPNRRTRREQQRTQKSQATQANSSWNSKKYHKV